MEGSMPYARHIQPATQPHVMYPVSVCKLLSGLTVHAFSGESAPLWGLPECSCLQADPPPCENTCHLQRCLVTQST